MLDNLERAINLAKKTGDRLIVFDSAKPANAYVVMSLVDYENLVTKNSLIRDLTEDELLDKINRDIAIWKSEQEYKDNLADQSDILAEIVKTGKITEKADNSRIFNTDFKEDFPRKKANSGWSIPDRRKQFAEEVIEEDRQYLEEIL